MSNGPPHQGEDVEQPDMGDPYWTDVARFLIGFPEDRHSILMPVGQWPARLAAATFYNYDQVVAADADFDIVVVNKATLPSFPQRLIRRLLSSYRYVFGNPVFCIFMRDASDFTGDEAHVGSLITYAEPKQFWRERPWRCSFIHIPKAAGTAIWRCVSEQIPSNIYFQSNELLRQFDGDINDFELVGGHVTAEMLRERGRAGHKFAVLRDPVERVFSFIAHARRLTDYRGSLDPSFVLAQSVSTGLGDELRDLILKEANFQVTMLGLSDPRELQTAGSIARALSKSLESLADPDWTIGVQDRATDLPRLIATAFHVDVDRLDIHNSALSEHRPADGAASDIRALFRRDDTLCGDQILFQLARRMKAERLAA